MADARRLAAEKRGRRSETWAALFLKLKFYRILARRMRNHAGEIDLIARSPEGLVCFIEVKARVEHGHAIDSVGQRQRARIARAAELFVASRPELGAKGMRFDIVTVSPRAFPRHIRDAWRPGD
jgi:putative endonuclease